MSQVLMVSSETCGPCKLLKPVLLDVCDELGVSVSIYTHTGPSDPLIQKYAIRSVPTILIREGDRVLKSITGVISREKLKEFIRSEEVK